MNDAKNKGTTVRVTEVRPPRPRVDKDAAFEQLVRQMFVPSVDAWCKQNMQEMPTKDARGNVVDNLTASFTSSFATLVESATDSYLSTVAEDGDDDGEEVECPDCGHVFELEPAEEGEAEDEEVTCPECKHDFVLAADDDDEDEDEDDEDEDEGGSGANGKPKRR